MQGIQKSKHAELFALHGGPPVHNGAGTSSLTDPLIETPLTCRTPHVPSSQKRTATSPSAGDSDEDLIHVRKRYVPAQPL